MRLVKIICLNVIGLLLIAIGMVWVVVEKSLPVIDGEKEHSSIQHSVIIHRDEYGVPNIQAQSKVDAMYALGYVHAQDRWFQMDLLRRNAAGELSELFGKGALSRDKKARFHQFRQRAEVIFASLPESQQLILQRYSQGVNQALAEMSTKPFEYWLVGAETKPWVPEDSLLVIYSMYLDLQGGQVKRDLALTLVEEEFGSAMVDFVLQPSFAQASLDQIDIPPSQAPIPELPTSASSARTDRQTQKQANIQHDFADRDMDIGSNNWAVSGQHTSDGLSLLSNDMHLGLNVPAIWYKAKLHYIQTEVAGVSLPGAPGIVVGATPNVAWGFTNANLDNVDWIRLPANVQLTEVVETIFTPEGNEAYTIELSEFGPVKKIGEQRYALSWVAHKPYANNFALLDFAEAKNLDELHAVAANVRIPVQNMMAADRTGNISYRPTGAITQRAPKQATAISPMSYDDAWQLPEMTPPIYRSPQYPKLWTANARVLSIDEITRFGDGGYALGIRGEQIAQRLLNKDSFTEADFMALQLDNRALFIRYWRDLLLETLRKSPEQYATDIDILERWQACACSSDVGYTLARKFRSEVVNTIFAPLYFALKKRDVEFWPINRHLEPALRQILHQQPQSWLPEDASDYAAMLMSSYDKAIVKLSNRHGPDIQQYTWGTVNALNIRHPISQQVPILSGWLDMPVIAGFGDSYMPAVQNGNHGASQRFIIAPGRWEDAIMTVPGGQSGHPLSPFYRKGFDDYAAHSKRPLLPGTPAHTLVLKTIH